MVGTRRKSGPTPREAATEVMAAADGRDVANHREASSLPAAVVSRVRAGEIYVACELAASLGMSRQAIATLKQSLRDGGFAVPSVSGRDLILGDDLIRLWFGKS